MRQPHFTHNNAVTESPPTITLTLKVLAECQLTPKGMIVEAAAFLLVVLLPVLVVVDVLEACRMPSLLLCGAEFTNLDVVVEELELSVATVWVPLLVPMTVKIDTDVDADGGRTGMSGGPDPRGLKFSEPSVEGGATGISGGPGIRGGSAMWLGTGAETCFDSTTRRLERPLAPSTAGIHGWTEEAINGSRVVVSVVSTSVEITNAWTMTMRIGIKLLYDAPYAFLKQRNGFALCFIQELHVVVPCQTG